MLGHILTKLRTNKKLTQLELSKLLKIPRSTYSNYESGKREPDFETTERLAAFFDVSVDYLLGRTERPKKVLSQDAKKIIEVLDIPDSEVLDNIELQVDGEKLSDQEVLDFVAYVRTRRQMKDIR